MVHPHKPLYLCLCVALLLLPLPTTPTTPPTPTQVDTLIWKYLLDKYSSTHGDSLSPTDLAALVRGAGDNKCDHLNVVEDTPPPTPCDQVGVPFPSHVRNLSSLNEICHKVLFFLDNPSCCELLKAPPPPPPPPVVGANAVGGVKREKPSSGEVWGYGILCVTLISLCSLAGVSVMPFMKKEFYKHLLTALVGLAVGSLMGSAVFHLIPQAFAMADNDPNHDYLFISLMVCGGIWMFFMLERILKFIMDYKDRKDKQWNREKIPSVVSSTPENSAILVENNGNCVKIPDTDVRPLSNGGGGGQSEPEVVYECQEQAIKASFGHQERPRLTSFHDHTLKFEQGKDSVIATVAYMIIFGDGLHNFIDGLSIGAAFNESILTGVSISMAVFCEELPHELGDFAVLLNAGMSIRQALTYNFLSACTCYIGMAVGILLGEIEASTYIFALAGGMFLYISLVDMVPEMNEIAEETSRISVKKGMWVLLLQNLGLFIGISTLFLLAKYQDHIQF